jgi:hypothetical protein
MRHIRDPNQEELFSPFAGQFSAVQERWLATQWPGVFRHAVLACLPADRVGEHFHPCFGIPTKELYSMVGLVMLAETFHWTADEAVEHYLFDVRTRYALNRPGFQDSMSVASFERYKRILREDGLAQEIFAAVTDHLCELLELDVSQQRLDSTHVFSDMATLGRTRLMGTCIKRFLTALKRREEAAYDALPSALRERYAPSEHRLFADGSAERSARRRLRQEVAEDLLWLVDRFIDDPAHRGRPTFTKLQRCLEEQCDVAEDRTAVTVREKTGGNVLQNPSDPDATYDGKKGPGYQVQCSETCAPENEVQLTVGAQVETAVVHDSHAVEPMLDDLEERGHQPETLLADTAYGSDDNVTAAAERGCDLVSPTPGAPAAEDDDVDRLGPDDVVTDADGRITACPAGERPIDSFIDDQGRAHAVMDGPTCARCPFQRECPMTRHVVKHQGEHNTDGPRPVITLDPKLQRRHERRRLERTQAFADQYRKRSGHESSFAGMKRRCSLGRLRTRGSPGVTLGCLLKITGWNVLRAAASTRMRQQIENMVYQALRGPSAAIFSGAEQLRAPLEALRQGFRPIAPDFPSFSTAPRLAA